jgi:autotransporter translocation and assembly factor TamB
MPNPWKFLCVGLIAGLTLAGTVSAAGSFDGTYKGSQTSTGTNNSQECASLSRDNVALTVQNNHFNRQWGEGVLSVDVAPDGSFATSVNATSGRRLRTIGIKGRIAGGNLEADIGSDLCSAHLSLKKS